MAFTNQALTELYNKVSDKEPIVLFKSKSVAMKAFATLGYATDEAVLELWQEKNGIVKPEEQAIADPPKEGAEVATKKTAPKKTKTKKTAAGTGSRTKIDPGTKVKILVDENPWREGSKRAARWGKVKGAKTVGDLFAVGIRPRMVKRMKATGLISF